MNFVSIIASFFGILFFLLHVAVGGIVIQQSIAAWNQFTNKIVPLALIIIGLLFICSGVTLTFFPIKTYFL